MAIHLMIKEAHSKGNCRENKWHKTFWWPNVDYLILETNWHVTMVLGILLACCLAVIIILFLTRNTKYVCDHRKGTVHSPEFIQWDIVFLQTKLYVSFVWIQKMCILMSLFSGTLSASNQVPHDSGNQEQQVNLFKIGFA